MGKGLLVCVAVLAAGAADAPDPLADTGQKAVSLIFVRTDCPVSNRYAPEIERLGRRFRAQGMPLWLVYSDPSENAGAVREHARAFGLSAATVLDVGHALARRAGVHITPEAAVFVREGQGWRVAYRGRIDNRFVKIGVMRQQATVHDLERALEDIAAGRPVRVPGAPAVGCSLSDLQ